MQQTVLVLNGRDTGSDGAPACAAHWLLQTCPPCPSHSAQPPRSCCTCAACRSHRWQHPPPPPCTATTKFRRRYSAETDRSLGSKLASAAWAAGIPGARACHTVQQGSRQTLPSLEHQARLAAPLQCSAAAGGTHATEGSTMRLCCAPVRLCHLGAGQQCGVVLDAHQLMDHGLGGGQQGRCAPQTGRGTLLATRGGDAQPNLTRSERGKAGLLGAVCIPSTQVWAMHGWH